jgi:hypothetical protein
MHGKDEKFIVSKKEGNRTLESLWHRHGTDMAILLKWILTMCVFQGMAVILVPIYNT